MGRRRHVPPFECEITGLGPRGVGVGTGAGDRVVHVRGAPPGGRVLVVPAGRRRGVLKGRRQALIRPPAEYDPPRCDRFGTCGGCVLQELSLPAQRREKHALAMAQVAAPEAVDHGVVGAPDAYGYRNKVELSFGVRQWVAVPGSSVPIAGRFLGFHAPGRFDRVVDAERCEIVSEAMNVVIQAVRGVALSDDAPLPYDPHSHEGFWRHLLVREGGGACLAVVYTGTPEHDAWVERVAEAVAPHVVGFEWRVNPGVADVARGEVRRTWGTPVLHERLGAVTLRISPTSFFQTSTEGCRVLYDTIGGALGTGGTLLDLYCGAGAIGLFLADRFQHIVGLEEVPAAVEDAKANAEANGIEAEYRVGRVEDALHHVVGGPDVHVVVDPPRAGLHPSVARAIAALQVESLVYVACNPASLARDAAILAEGGWRITDLWTVDLFPQTGHVEVVARLAR